MTLDITFFDKVKYKSTDFGNRDADFFGAGVVHLTDFPLTYPTTPNMTVNVGAGTAWSNGYRVTNDTSPVALTFATADATNPRIDIIQIGYTATTDANGDTTGSAVLQVKEGVAAATPIEPGADPNFVKLYAVSIAANQTTVTAANVTDRRSLVPLNVDGSQITNFSGVTTSYLKAIVADLFGDTSVVLSGGVATKDGTVVNQLDVTAANVYFSTGEHVQFGASSNGQFTTSVANATYYLDYNPDGTTSWGTSHSAASGYVPICTVAVDTSGNIATVLDARPLTVNLFNTTDMISILGGFVVNGQATFNGGITGTGDTGTLTAGTGILQTQNTWTAGQSFSGVTLNDITGAKWQAHPGSYRWNFAQETTTPGMYTDVFGFDTGQSAPGVGLTTYMRGLIPNQPFVVTGFSSVTFKNPINTQYDSNYLQSGATADFNSNDFAVGIAAPAGTILWPFGVMVGGGANAIRAFAVDTAGDSQVYGDMILSRTDTAIAYVVRPNTAGFKEMALAVQGGGSLDTLHLNAVNTNTTGSITTPSGELGSAEGVWTPAPGTFNVVAGTVINIAAVPSAAKMFQTGPRGGTYSYAGTIGFMSSTKGSAWWASNGSNSLVTGAASGVSATGYAGTVATVYDGAYYTNGYFQINGGYLQFVTTSAATANSATGITLAWAVS